MNIRRLVDVQNYTKSVRGNIMSAMQVGGWGGGGGGKGGRGSNLMIVHWW